jgi:hypothetical protein
VLEQATAKKTIAPSVITVPAPRAAVIPTKTGATAAARAADSALPVASRSTGASVASELRLPIEQLRSAIESRLPSRMEDVYKAYEQDDPTKKYFRGIIDKADSVHVKSIAYQNSNVTGKTAELNFKMILDITANSSKIPTEVQSTWRANLVREGPRKDWKLQRLVPIKL